MPLLSRALRLPELSTCRQQAACASPAVKTASVLSDSPPVTLRAAPSGYPCLLPIAWMDRRELNKLDFRSIYQILRIAI